MAGEVEKYKEVLKMLAINTIILEEDPFKLGDNSNPRHRVNLGVIKNRIKLPRMFLLKSQILAIWKNFLENGLDDYHYLKYFTRATCNIIENSPR